MQKLIQLNTLLTSTKPSPFGFGDLAQNVGLSSKLLMERLAGYMCRSPLELYKAQHPISTSRFTLFGNPQLVVDKKQEIINTVVSIAPSLQEHLAVTDSIKSRSISQALLNKSNGQVYEFLKQHSILKDQNERKAAFVNSKNLSRNEFREYAEDLALRPSIKLR